MKKSLLNILLLSSVAAFGLTACDNKGPAEAAGEKLDSSVEQVQEQAKDAVDNANETLAVEEKGTMEKAGEKLDEAAADVKETAQDVAESAGEQVEKAQDAVADAAAAADKKLEELKADDNN
ncbi:hypothetical protein [Oceanisphaera sp. W20_SRM_FM3]|uniref:hypothetical protein n=1 Tax=Oceanisphaera sp. W20_SRM_FM3 TaxID=3240267 RepID=UPI003F9C526B